MERALQWTPVSPGLGWVSLKGDPERTWVQDVYLGGDPRKHKWKGAGRGTGKENTVIRAFLRQSPVCATRAPSWGPSGKPSTISSPVVSPEDGETGAFIHWLLSPLAKSQPWESQLPVSRLCLTNSIARFPVLAKALWQRSGEMRHLRCQVFPWQKLWTTAGSELKQELRGCGMGHQHHLLQSLQRFTANSWPSLSLSILIAHTYGKDIVFIMCQALCL